MPKKSHFDSLTRAEKLAVLDTLHHGHVIMFHHAQKLAMLAERNRREARHDRAEMLNLAAWLTMYLLPVALFMASLILRQAGQ